MRRGTSRQGKVQALVLIEVMAQTAAVLVGWNKRHEEKMGGRGWLVGVRKTNIDCGPVAVNTALRCHIELAYKVDN